MNLITGKTFKFCYNSYAVQNIQVSFGANWWAVWTNCPQDPMTAFLTSAIENSMRLYTYEVIQSLRNFF